MRFSRFARVCVHCSPAARVWEEWGSCQSQIASLLGFELEWPLTSRQLSLVRDCWGVTRSQGRCGQGKRGWGPFSKYCLMATGLLLPALRRFKPVARAMPSTVSEQNFTASIPSLESLRCIGFVLCAPFGWLMMLALLANTSSWVHLPIFCPVAA